VQVQPIKPTLKAPGIKHFKLKYNKPHSNFAFTFNLRRYTKGETKEAEERAGVALAEAGLGRKCSKCPSTTRSDPLYFKKLRGRSRETLVVQC